jgi:hypothetical protein
MPLRRHCPAWPGNLEVIAMSLFLDAPVEPGHDVG